MGKQITMKDVAREMGVSTVTVSKALSGREGVGTGLREEIKKKAADMGYRYNSMAKAMKEGRTYNIGILVPERFFSDNAFYTKLYKELIVRLNTAGYSGILEIIPEREEEKEVLPNIAANSKIDGIILMGQTAAGYVGRIRLTGIPCLLLDFHEEQSAVDSVVSDNVYGACLLTEYLISQGHRDIAFVGTTTATDSILDRYLGYQKALIRHGLPLRQDWVLADRDQKGWFTGLELPAQMPTAFVCNCDETAYRLLERLEREGVGVPGDVSVAGFDDHAFAALCRPALTTFRVDISAMSALAVEGIVRKLRHSSYRRGRQVISGELIIRDSVRTNT